MILIIRIVCNLQLIIIVIIRIMPIIYTTTNDTTSTIYRQLVYGIEKQATQTSSAVETAGGRSHSGDLRNK